jgi:hypothetical protein
VDIPVIGDIHAWLVQSTSRKPQPCGSGLDRGGFCASDPALIALVALTIMQPAAPGWISQAAQAEFGIVNSPEIVPTQPAMQIRTVKAY